MGATTIESPVWTPIGSMFSMPQIGDRGVGGVAEDLELDLVPAEQAALHQDLADGAGAQAVGDALARLGEVQGEAAAAAAEARRPAAARRDGRLRSANAIAVRRRSSTAALRRTGSPMPVQQLAESAAVLGRANRVERRAEHAHAVAIQHAGLVQRDRQVEPGLPAHGRQQPVGPLLLDDRGQGLERQRPDEITSADVGVGHAPSRGSS